MDFRALFLNNLPWKISALALAAFTWLSIHWKGLGERSNEASFPKDVRVLSAPNDTRTFHLGQARAEVTVSASARDLAALSQDDIQVFVDLSDAPPGLGVARRLQAHAPEGIKIVRITPSRIYVEPFNPLEESLTNSIVHP